MDYDSIGHVDTPLLDRLGVTRDGFLLVRPPSFLKQLTEGLRHGAPVPRSSHTRSLDGSFDHTRESLRPPILRFRPRRTSIGPQISFTRSELTIPWDSRFSSLLEFAEACDVPVQWSCRVGLPYVRVRLDRRMVHYSPIH